MYIESFIIGKCSDDNGLNYSFNFNNGKYYIKEECDEDEKIILCTRNIYDAYNDWNMLKRHRKPLKYHGRRKRHF